MFEGRIELLGKKELPGAVCYNALARALKYSRSESPNIIQLGVHASGGLTIKIGQSLIEALSKTIVMPLDVSINDDYISVAGGTVHLVDRRLSVASREIDQMYEGMCIWVRITKLDAEIKYGGSFPDATDISEERCNWPIAKILEVNDTYSVKQLHRGDIVVLAMPHCLISGYSTKLSARMLSNGKEKYIETGDCDEEDMD